MILKISYVQNKSNPTYRGLVEVDTNNYPQLNNLSEALVIGYITNNGQNMNPTTSGYTSLKEQLMSQPDITFNYDDCNGTPQTIGVPSAGSTQVCALVDSIQDPPGGSSSKGARCTS